jgi:hypothetical protein
MTCRNANHEGFERPVAYIFKPTKQAVLIHSTTDATDPAGIASEMASHGKGSTRCRLRAAHIVFSLADNERMTFEQWREFDQLFRQRFGFDHGLLVTHGDTTHDHAHFVGHRCKLNGKTVISSFERLRLREFCMEMEKHFGLTRTPARSAKARVNKDELEKGARLHREGKRPTPVPDRMAIAAAVRAAYQQAPTLAAFEERLLRQRVTTQWRYDESGKAIGVSFGRGEASITGKHAGVSAHMLSIHYSPTGTTTHEQSRRDTIASGITPVAGTSGAEDCRLHAGRVAGQHARVGENPPSLGLPCRSPGDIFGNHPEAIGEVGALVNRTVSGLMIMCEDLENDGKRFNTRAQRKANLHRPIYQQNRPDITR